MAYEEAAEHLERAADESIDEEEKKAFRIVAVVFELLVIVLGRHNFEPLAVSPVQN